MKIPSKLSAGTFLGTLMVARNVVHIKHLQARGVGSFAEHSALDDLYNGLPGYIDSLAEQYQGRMSIIEKYTFPDMSSSAKSIDIVTEMRTFIDNHRKAMTDYSEIQNIVDELIALLNKTIYKLRYLV